MITIQPISLGQTIPYDLLLLADPDREKIDLYLPGAQTFVATHDDLVIGICVLKMHGQFHFEVMNIAIAPNYQGQGIGKSLLLYAIDRAKNAGGVSISIATGNSSTGQIALYQKVGFAIIEIIKDYFIDNYPEPIWEHGIQCRDRVLMKMTF